MWGPDLSELHELAKERTYGDAGEDVARDIPVIDIRDIENRRGEVTEDLWQAATELGFFQIVGHAIPTELIDAAFAQSEALFSQTPAAKAEMTMVPGTNAGWEYKPQVRPSTGTADQKESYQITLPRLTGHDYIQIRIGANIKK